MQNSTHTTAQILVISSHPNPKNSLVNRAILQSIDQLPGVIHRNLSHIYNNDTNAIDIALERSFYQGIKHIIFIFPLHYFNVTPMLKAYMNKVWYPWANEHLKSKHLHLIVSAGAPKEAFGAHGIIKLDIDQIFAPMQACANLLAMQLQPTLCFYDVLKASSQEIQQYCQVVKQKITTLS